MLNDFYTLIMGETEARGNQIKAQKKGIVYLSTIPPFMNVTKLTEIMCRFGKVGRVFLQPATSKTGRLCNFYKLITGLREHNLKILS